MWAVTAHECGGSTAEAMDVRAAFGGFQKQENAKEFSEVLYEQLTKQDPYGEWYTQWFELPEIQKIVLPQITDPQELQALGMTSPPPEGAVALDMRAVAKKVLEGEDFEPRAIPPNDDEVQAAIASITGGAT